MATRHVEPFLTKKDGLIYFLKLFLASAATNAIGHFDFCWNVGGKSAGDPQTLFFSFFSRQNTN